MEELSKLELWLDDLSLNAVRFISSGGVVPIQMIFADKIMDKGFSKKAFGQTKKKRINNYPHHNHKFKSIALRSSKQLNRENFKVWCEQLPPSVIRGKGILFFSEEPG